VVFAVHYSLLISCCSTFAKGDTDLPLLVVLAILVIAIGLHLLREVYHCFLRSQERDNEERGKP